MKHKLVYLALVLALGMVISAQVFFQSSSAKDRTVWEYTKVFASVAGNGNGAIESFNKLGAEGWELVAIEHPTEKWGDGYYYVFKRPKY